MMAPQIGHPFEGRDGGDPSNTLRAIHHVPSERHPPDGPVPILTGLDGVTIDIFGHPDPNVLDRVLLVRDRIRKNSGKPLGRDGHQAHRFEEEIPLAGISFTVKARANPGCSFWLESQDVRLDIRERGTADFPLARARFKAALTWKRRDPDELHVLADKLAKALAGPRAFYRISGFALTCDFVGLDVWNVPFGAFRCRAPKKDRGREGADPCPSLWFGRAKAGRPKNLCRARLYRKDLEDQEPHPLWHESPAYAPGAPVTRVEFELYGAGYIRRLMPGGEVDCSSGFHALARGATSLWKHFTSKWLVLRRASKSGRITQRVDPRWRQVQAVTFFDSAAMRVVRRLASRRTTEMALAAAIGSIASWAAGLHLDEQTIRDGLWKAIDMYLAEKGESFQARLEAKRRRHAESQP